MNFMISTEKFLRKELPNNLFIGLFIISFGILFTISLKNAHPVYNEIQSISNTRLYLEKGLTQEFLLSTYNQAPGPLYQIFYGGILGSKNLDIRNLRVVNFLLMLFSMLIIFYSFKDEIMNNHLILVCFSIISIPMVWVIGGMALTEIPAIFFLTIFLVNFNKLSLSKLEKVQDLILCNIICGASLGLAIIGRTQYLLILPLSFFFLFFFQPRNSENLFSIIYVVVASLICIPVFWVWQGLVPPQVKYTDEEGFNLWHGIIGLSYLYMVFVFVSPKLFTFNVKALSILSLVLVIFWIFNYNYWKIEFTPMRYTALRVFNGNSLKIYSTFIPATIMTLCSHLFYCLFLRWREIVVNKIYLFSLLSCILISFSAIKVTSEFSSRYVIQSLPFIMVVAIFNSRNSVLQFLIYLIGIAIGVLTILGYYNSF